ncbi:MAG TPA: TlpA disulfide reductase family protein [Isosphaeraceae bacterium]|jgi:hypothetical protein|nr:TlpA disulfide reductase family protein [Isosphaeraceae bacterium]
MTEEKAEEEIRSRRWRRLDYVSLAMALVAVLALGKVAWLRFGPPAGFEPPKVGTVPPPLRLLDLNSVEPIVLLGLREKVVWVTFWSASSPSGQDDLKELEGVWQRLKKRPRFTMVAAAVEADHPEQVRSALAETGATLPVYLASPETLRAWGCSQTPLHLLLDTDGRVLALARGREVGVLRRLTHLALQRLNLLEPAKPVRFAWDLMSGKAVLRRVTTRKRGATF